MREAPEAPRPEAPRPAATGLAATGLTGTFAVADLDTVRLESDRRLVQVTLALLLAPSVWFIRTDLTFQLSAPDLLSTRFAARLAFLIIILLGIWWVRRVADRAAYQRAVFGTSLAIVLFSLLLNWMRPQGSVLPLRTPLLILLLLYAGLVNTPRRQITPPIIFSVGLIALRLFWVNSGESGTIDGDILVIVVMNAAGVLLVLNRQKLVFSELDLWAAERRARESLARSITELRALRGIIPICSYCREVRTELGDWQKLESYVQAHSDADFSHGMCPSCVEKHFPGLTTDER